MVRFPQAQDHLRNRAMLQTVSPTPAGAAEPLPSATETGLLGVHQLKRAWARQRARRQGRFDTDQREFLLDHLVFDALGIGLEQTLQYLGQAAPTFEEFEGWIVTTTGGVPDRQVARINAAVTGTEYPADIRRWLAEVEASEPVLSADDLAFWDEHGYVVVHDAVPAATREAATAAVLDHLDVRLDDPESWYGRKHSIMVQYFQHPAFDANRRSHRIHKAFAQLWGNADLWVSTDRVGFNPPERPGWRFPGPDLHWDESLHQPIPLSTHGILYLTDTEAEQGAFTVVPGFHRRVGAWLAGLPAGADPRQQNLHALGSRPIAGRAGDLVIWHGAIPHGSRPNRAAMPRIVQYVRMYPTRPECADVWI
jgi:ectoine hydroxylase-related dioxygenase (phytanoyl-CoA dioxygenase family)